MTGSRIERLRAFLATRPDDAFARYALALEHKNAGELAEADAVFSDLIRTHADYTAAYLHAGNTLVALGRTEDARRVYTSGLDACKAKADSHGHSELNSALALLPAAAC